MTRRILQFDHLGKRRTLSLGRFDRKMIAAIRSHVDQIRGAAEGNRGIPLDTERWLQGIGDKLHAKLVACDLIPPRIHPDAMTLEGMCDTYIARRADLAPRSLVLLKQTKRELTGWFGGKRDPRLITHPEAKDWQRQLLSRFARATVALFTKRGRQIFADAAERKLIDLNPLVGVKAGKMDNPTRMQYVPALDIEKVIDACPDDEWRLIFALARYAGVRVPSEVQPLTWDDVNWQGKTMLVRSPKTRRHPGREQRVVPIAPELWPRLLTCFDATPDGATHIIARHRGENLRTTAEKIIGRAGLLQWPKLFQNLRASCETDWTARFPVHVACAWIGNTENVARKHYLMVKDEDWQKATGRAAPGAAEGGGIGRKAAERDTADHTENAGFSEQSAVSPYPLGRSNYPANFYRNLHGSHRALQQALHVVQGQHRLLSQALPYINASDIGELTVAVREAQAADGRPT